MPSLKKAVRPGRVMMNKLLAAVAVDCAGDWDNANPAFEVRRNLKKTWRWLLQAVMRQLGELTGKHVGWELRPGNSAALAAAGLFGRLPSGNRRDGF